jgi:hypothetical protein
MHCQIESWRCELKVIHHLSESKNHSHLGTQKLRLFRLQLAHDLPINSTFRTASSAEQSIPEAIKVREVTASESQRLAQHSVA